MYLLNNISLREIKVDNTPVTPIIICDYLDKTFFIMIDDDTKINLHGPMKLIGMENIK